MKQIEEKLLLEVEHTFAKDMIKRRKLLNISQTQLSEMTGLSQRIISSIERKETSIRLVYFLLIAKALQIDLNKSLDKLVKKADELNLFEKQKNKLNAEEKRMILKMNENGLNINTIASIVEKEKETIEKFLENSEIDKE